MFIYILVYKIGEIFKDLCKIGSAEENIQERISGYKTSYPIFSNRTHDLHIFELISNSPTCREIERIIKHISQYSNFPYKWHNNKLCDDAYKNNGGEEFYYFTDIKSMHEFFELLHVEYKYTKADLNTFFDDMSYERERSISSDISKWTNMIFSVKEKLNIIMRDYQQDTINKTLEYLKTYSIGKIILPCGTGKSFVMFEAILAIFKFPCAVFVPSLTLLSQIGSMFDKLLTQYDSDIKMIFIGSDYNDKILNKHEIFTKSDTEYIKKYINKHKKVIIVSTYQSCLCLADLDLELILFDEAHRTAVAQKSINSSDSDDSDSDIYSGFSFFVAQYKHKCIKLFFTATEKIVGLNNLDDPDEVLQVISMDDEKLYGKTINQMTLREAIERNAVSNYKIIRPDKCIDDFINKDMKESIIAKYGKYIKSTKKNKLIIAYYAKCIILKENIPKYKFNKIVTKHTKIEHCNLFCEMLKDNLKDLDVLCDVIDGELSIPKRQIIIDKFKSAKISIICSAKCLVEGVDIPCIDCVMPVDEIESSIDIYQFLLRGFRLFPSKQYAYIFLPLLLSEDDDMINWKREYNNVRIVLRTMEDHDELIKQQIQTGYVADNGNIICGDGNLIIFDNSDVDNSNIKIKKLFRDLNTKIITDLNSISPETYDKAREYISSLNLRTKKDFYKWCDNRSNHFNIPKNPDVIYKTCGWTTWKAFLGSNVWDISDVQKIILAHNKSLSEKIKEIKEYKIKFILANHGPISLDDLENKYGIKKEEKILKIKNVDKDKNDLYMCDHVDFLMIDCKQKYDRYVEYHKECNLPSFDELEEMNEKSIDINDFFKINMSNYLSWDDLVKTARKFYKENQNNKYMYNDYYNELLILNNKIPKDPSIYKEFTNYKNLFCIEEDE